jgi:formamidopyrimidine-DNA glycosylase
MPELPEVETIKRSLETELSGREIIAVHYYDFPGVTGDVNPEVFCNAVVGSRFSTIDRRGKNLYLRFDNGYGLGVHLMMTGQLLLTTHGQPTMRFERLRLDLDNRLSLVFADQRKFGRVLFMSAEGWRQIDEGIGPEPLAREFTAKMFSSVLMSRKAPVKSVLLNQRAIAGIGNIYADEALFAARIHPARPANSLTALEVSKLHRALRTTLAHSIQNRGTTFSSYRDGSGGSGSNQHALKVYGKGRSGAACTRCGGSLMTLQVSGRTSHLCAHCQPLSPEPNKLGLGPRSKLKAVDRWNSKP